MYSMQKPIGVTQVTLSIINLYLNEKAANFLIFD